MVDEDAGQLVAYRSWISSAATEESTPPGWLPPNFPAKRHYHSNNLPPDDVTACPFRLLIN
jgi:hypothetical protein